MLAELRQQGIRIAVDDFGTGYSSLAYLQRWTWTSSRSTAASCSRWAPVSRDDVLVRSIIELAHNLGLSVVAEGVESPAQVERLRELECDAAQGFHLGRPMDRDMMTAWLRRDTMLEPLRLPEGTTARTPCTASCRAGPPRALRPGEAVPAVPATGRSGKPTHLRAVGPAGNGVSPCWSPRW